MSEAAIHNLLREALAHHQGGRFDEARRGYERVLERAPNEPDALHLLGLLAHQQGDHARAIELMGRAIALRPGAAEFYVNVAAALQAVGDNERAIESLRRAVELAPDLPEAYSNLGGALAGVGQVGKAVQHFQRALSLRPQYEGARIGLASAFARQRRVAEAVGCLREAIRLHPRSAAARVNLADLLRQMGRVDEAAELLRQAIEFEPNMPQAYHNLGTALFELGLLEEARQAFSRAMELRPSDSLAAENYLLTLYRDAGASPEGILEAHRQWGRKFADPLTAGAPAVEADRDPDRRLRVGYVGSSFNDNPPARRFLEPLFRNHNREWFEITAYSDVEAEDETTRRLRGYCDRWNSIVGLTDAQLAERIRADRIDVLVDLSLHAGGNRLLAFARRAAPVQLTYLAYAGTSGMRAMDWRLTDACLDPSSYERFYSEKSFRLRSYWGYEAPKEGPEVASLPANRAGYITFGCLNQFSKVRPETIAVWGRCMKAAGDSRLILRCDEGSPRVRTRELFESHGVSGGRIEFVGAQPFIGYLETYNRIDIALDPFPCAGGTTTCDALWMGVPVITLAGAHALARAGVSVLTNGGLPEMVADSNDRYVEIATKLAGNLSELSECRAALRQKMSSSTLCDVRGFARDFEGAVRQIWRAWCVS